MPHTATDKKSSSSFVVNKYDLTIITVSFNDLEGLRATSKPILEVLRFNERVEWLVIDGGSSDGSREFLEKVQFERFSFVSESDGGIYQGMKKGVHLARGAYINFMNSGDVPNINDYTSALLEVVSGIKSGMVFAYSSEFAGLKKSEIYSPILLKFPGHQAMFFPKDLILEYGFDFKRLKVSNDLLHKALAWRDGKLQYNNKLTIVCCDPFGTSRSSVNFRQYVYRMRERYLIGTRLFGVLFGFFCVILYLVWNFKKLRFR
jgi:glycosyltransferase involved in cell wall biosynthesis